MKQLNRRKLFKSTLVLPVALLFKACSTPQQRANTRQETRIEGRTGHRQQRRRDW